MCPNKCVPVLDDTSACVKFAPILSKVMNKLFLQLLFFHSYHKDIITFITF